MANIEQKCEWAAQPWDPSPAISAQHSTGPLDRRTRGACSACVAKGKNIQTLNGDRRLCLFFQTHMPRPGHRPQKCLCQGCFLKFLGRFCLHKTPEVRTLAVRMRESQQLVHGPYSCTQQGLAMSWLLRPGCLLGCSKGDLWTHCRAVF